MQIKFSSTELSKGTLPVEYFLKYEIKNEADGIVMVAKDATGAVRKLLEIVGECRLVDVRKL